MDREGDSSPAALGARLRFALELVETGIDMKRCSLRREYPDADDAQIQELVNEWLLERPPLPDDLSPRPLPPELPP
jgi:Rv0078B-related antitoxin